MFSELRKGKIAFFKRFLISYLFILIIPLALTSVAYNQAVKIVEGNAIDSRLFMLGHIRDSVDKYFKDLDETIVLTALDSKLNRLLYYSQPREGSSDMYLFYEYANYVRSKLSTNNTFRSSFYIFFKNNESIFANNKTDFGIEGFFNDYLNYSNMQYSQWYDIFLNQYNYRRALPAQKVKIDGAESSAITYLYSIPMREGRNQPEGVIAYLINEEEINKLLKGVNADGDGWAYITDKSGQLISGSSSNSAVIESVLATVGSSDGYTIKSVAGENMIFVYTQSQYNDWTYTAVLPMKTVMGKVLYVKQVIIAVLLVSLLIGVFVSFFLAYRNTKPFKEVFLTLKDFFNAEGDKLDMQERMSDYAFLQGSISNLISNNKTLQSSLQRQASTLKTVFLDRLLKGEFDDRNKMETLLSYVGLDIQGNSFIVMVLKINRNDNLLSRPILEELDVFRVIIEEILYKNIGEKCYLHMLNENEMALLLGFSTAECHDNTDIIHEITGNVKQEALAHFHIAPIIGIGNMYRNLFDVHYSFIEARQALNAYEECKDQGDTVLWYRDIRKTDYSYYYSSDLEQKILSFAKSGSWSELESALDKVFRENFIKNTLSDAVKNTLLYDLQATLTKLLDDTRLKTEVSGQDYVLLSKGQPDKFFKWLKDAYRQICKEVANNRKSHNTKLKEGILEFINENYTDGNLSVAAVASQFNLSESYLSQFFREQTGETFSSYLENMRIRMACQLLSENSLSIDEISRRTGYNNTNSFRRAFKRVMGIAPSAYSDIEHNNS